MPRRAIALVLLALAACTPRVAPPLAPRWFEIDSQMLAFLDTIHAGLPDEVALCLNGAVRGGVVKKIGRAHV